MLKGVKSNKNRTSKRNNILINNVLTPIKTHKRIFFPVPVSYTHLIIRKTPDKIFPEYYLIRVNEFNKLAVTPLEEWITYLKTGKISSEAKAPGLPEAREKLRYYDCLLYTSLRQPTFPRRSQSLFYGLQQPSDPEWKKQRNR